VLIPVKEIPFYFYWKGRVGKEVRVKTMQDKKKVDKKGQDARTLKK